MRKDIGPHVDRMRIFARRITFINFKVRDEKTLFCGHGSVYVIVMRR